MNFPEAMDLLGLTAIEAAEHLGSSPAAVRQARLDPGATGYRKPPTGWEAVFARLARGKLADLERLAELGELQAEPPGARDSKEPLSPERFGWWLMTMELRQLVSYHNVIQAMVLQEAQRMEDVRPRLVEWYRAMNATNTFLLVFAYLEEVLCDHWRAGRSDDPGPGLRGFRPILGDFVSRPAWPELLDGYRVRNFILHQYGRKELLDGRKKGNIERIVAEKEGLELTKGRIRVFPSYLDVIVEAAYELREWILEDARRLRRSGGKGAR